MMKTKSALLAAIIESVEEKKAERKLESHMKSVITVILSDKAAKMLLSEKDVVSNHYKVRTKGEQLYMCDCVVAIDRKQRQIYRLAVG